MNPPAASRSPGPERGRALPADVSGFVGRRGELAQLADLLASTRLVTVAGPGGVGKTRLALRAATEAGRRDGAVLVELSGLTEPELLCDTVAQRLGLYRTESPAPLDAVLSELRDRELLLVLDTCEHLAAACARFVTAVLRETSGVTVLATSRQPLHVAGEKVLRLGPLPVPPEDSTAGDSTAGTDPTDAVDLFAQRAAAAVSGFTLTAADRPHAIRLCRRLDGIPLAIELAAVRVRALPVAELAERVGAGLTAETGTRRGIVSRHQTLRAAIEWSYELCTEAERAAWRRLSVFAGSFSLPVARELMAGGELPAEQADEVITSLVDKSVVLPAGPGRLRLLDSVREYGAERLGEAGEDAAWRQRHLARYLRLVSEFSHRLVADGQGDRLATLRAEHANLRGALEFGLTATRGRGADPAGRTRPAARLAAALFPYWVMSGSIREGIHWQDKTLDLFTGPSPERASALANRALLGATVGLPEAAGQAGQAIAMSARIGDARTEARSYLALQFALTTNGHYQEALEAATEARWRLEALGADHALRTLDMQLALTYVHAGDFDAAFTCSRRLLVSLGPGERWLRGNAHALVALAHYPRPGHQDECAAAASAALRASAEIGNLVGAAYALEVIAWLAADAGRWQRAGWMLGAAQGLWERTGGRLSGSAALEGCHQRCATAAASALGSARYSELHAAGATWPLAEIAALVTGEADALPGQPAAGPGRPRGRPPRAGCDGAGRHGAGQHGAGRQDQRLGRRGRAHHPRAGDRPARHPRAVQPGDRRAPGHLQADGGRARPPHLRQTGTVLPGAADDLAARAGARQPDAAAARHRPRIVARAKRATFRVKGAVAARVRTAAARARVDLTRSEPGSTGRNRGAKPVPATGEERMSAGQAARQRPQLPVETTGFVGREAELARLSRLLERARLVTVTGPGGVGKTRLALRAAAAAAPGFADGTCLVELSALREPGALVDAVARALGLPEPARGAGLDPVLAHLGGRQLLLILDTCEHLVDACAMLAEAVIARAPRVTMLATSREPLDISGENACPVPPLTVPGLDRRPRETEAGPGEAPAPGDTGDPGLTGYRGTAVELFLQRAAAAVPGFAPGPDDLAQVVRICRRLDGLPLAIELAAVRLRALPLPELASRLDASLTLLASGARGGRHRSLRDAMRWSYVLCTPGEQALWARLSVFAGPFTMSAAEQVCAGDLRPEQVMPTLIRLVDKSLLIRIEPPEAGGPPTRYVMLGAIREFGAEQLAGSDDETPARNRLIHRYLAMARYFRDHFADDDQLARLSELRREHANIQAALEYALGDGPGLTADGAELATALCGYWRARGLLPEGVYWLSRATQRVPAGSAARARALIARAHLLTAQGGGAEATATAAAGLDIASGLGEVALIARAHLAGTAALAAAGQLTAAAESGEEAFRLLTTRGDHLGLVGLDIQLTYLALRNDDIPAALGHIERGLRRLGRSRERWLHATLYLLAALALYQAGRDIESTWTATRALEVKHETGDATGTALAVEILAWLAARSGRPERAAWLLGGADSLWQQAGGRAAAARACARPHDGVVADCAGALGGRRFTELFARGAAQPSAALLAFALHDDGDPAPEEGVKIRLPGQLTTREREIASLVAAGLSNRQIAERLFISRRTVDAHLEHIFGKLGITSRVMLTIQLRDYSAGAAAEAGA